MIHQIINPCNEIVRVLFSLKTFEFIVVPEIKVVAERGVDLGRLDDGDGVGFRLGFGLGSGRKIFRER